MKSISTKHQNKWCSLRAVSLFSTGLVRGVNARESVDESSSLRRKKKASGAYTVTRVVNCVSRAFCSKDQEKRKTAGSLSEALP